MGNSDTVDPCLGPAYNVYMLIDWGAGRGGGGPGGPTATRLAAHFDDFALSRMEIQENNRHGTKTLLGSSVSQCSKVRFIKFQRCVLGI